MKTLGIIGGMSWESTALYYRDVNRGVAARRGGLHSAPLLLHSVDFAPVAELQRRDDWAAAAALLADAARGLVGAGAQGLLIATNTMHKVAAAVEAAAGVPLLHIADATGAALRDAGVRRAGLLGTRFTMDDPSIVGDRLRERFGVETLVPSDAGRSLLQRVIYDELCRGIVSAGSRAAVVAEIAALRGRGADAVIFGCTEITLLVGTGDSPLPVFDSTALHAAAAVDWICSETR